MIELPNKDNVQQIKDSTSILKIDGERAKKLVEALGTSNSLVDTLKEALGIQIRRSTEDSNLLNINKRINKSIQGQLGDITNIDEFQKQIIKNDKLIYEGNIAIKNIGSILQGTDLQRSILS